MQNPASSTSYRPEIDCLRAFALLLVILFHCDLPLFKNGFIGVDIFFIISGFIMYRATRKTKFWQLRDIFLYYQKRLLRIYPALLMMVFLTAICGALWMNVAAYDYFGKQMFFASLSASNILFSQGHNYFDKTSPIFLHTWSLGIEMQFYALLPIILLAQHYLSKYLKVSPMIFIGGLLIATFCYAHFLSIQGTTFFIFQARIFEFFIGMFTATIVKDKQEKKVHSGITTLIIYTCICASIIVFSYTYYHPGLSTLVPLLLCAVYITYYSYYNYPKGKIVNLFTYTGRISYGIYLYHFPVTIFAKNIFFLKSWELLLANILITLPLAHLSYKWFETPLRQCGYQRSKKSLTIVLAVTITSLILAASGYIIAKKQGIPERLRFFNSYAYKVAQVHEQSRDMFTRGYDVSSYNNSRILFIGDSVLQQYIAPISSALGISKNEIDSVTRGGCLLLKGSDFKDSFADISCDDLRHKLYNNSKKYDYIVISQAWGSYQNNLLNAEKPIDKHSYHYILPFLEETIEHFQKYSSNIIVLGIHPTMKYNALLNIGPRLNKQQYQSFKDSLMINKENKSNKTLLNVLSERYNAKVFHTIDIFCSNKECVTQNDQWSYFKDSEHLTTYGQELAKDYFEGALGNLR